MNYNLTLLASAADLIRELDTSATSAPTYENAIERTNTPNGNDAINPCEEGPKISKSAEKRKLAFEWFERAILPDACGSAFEYSPDIYSSYCAYYRNEKHLLLSRSSRHGFFGLLNSYFKSKGLTVRQGQRQRGRVRRRGYYGLRLIKQCSSF